MSARAAVAAVVAVWVTAAELALGVLPACELPFTGAVIRLLELVLVVMLVWLGLPSRRDRRDRLPLARVL